MPIFHVTVRVTGEVTIQVEAKDAEAAADLALEIAPEEMAKIDDDFVDYEVIRTTAD